MSNPNEDQSWNKNAREIQARAASWIEERESEDWSQNRQTEFDAWIAQSPAHLVAYLRADAVWKRADRLRALSRAGGAESGPMKPGASAITSPRRTYFKIAAALVAMSFAAGAGVFVYLHGSKSQAYSTTVGGRETLTLDDGSQIELNTNTTVRVAYEGKRRSIWLDKGEAYFNVTHDAARPFVVRLGNRQVTDLGTKFFIRRDGARVQVALVEGKARFDATLDPAPSQQTILAPGDVLVATADAVSLKKKTTQDLANKLGWRRGMLVFEHASLAEVASEYNRYNRTKLVIAGPEAARLTISGTLPTNDLGAFTRMAVKFFNLHIEKREGEIVVSH